MDTLAGSSTLDISKLPNKYDPLKNLKLIRDTIVGDNTKMDWLWTWLHSFYQNAGHIYDPSLTPSGHVLLIKDLEEIFQDMSVAQLGLLWIFISSNLKGHRKQSLRDFYQEALRDKLKPSPLPPVNIHGGI